MTPPFSSPAVAPLAPEAHRDQRQHPAAQLVPDWHGRYQARRGRRRSDARLLRYLNAMAVAAIIGTALLLSFLLLQDVRETDRLHAETASLEATVAVEDILEEVAATIESVAPALNAYSTDPDVMPAAAQRQSRRDIFTRLADSPVAGLALVDAHGTVLLETGDAERVNLASWTKLPLEPNAWLLEQQVAFLSPETDRGVQALFMLPDRERAIIALIDEMPLADALRPNATSIGQVYLYDDAGRILSAAHGSGRVAGVADPVHRAGGISGAETRVSTLNVEAAFKDRGQAVSRSLNEAGLHIMALPRPITISRFIGAVGHLLLAGIVLAVLTIGLLVYIIQTEWKKHDRRASLDEDVVARAEIAADIMGAGIIDWRVSDAVVSYSEGWQRLFSEGSPTEDEEIFDWIDKLHPDCRSQARENYEALLEGRIFEVEHEIQVRRRDGEYVSVRERGRARMNARGSATRVVLVQRPTRG